MKLNEFSIDDLVALNEGHTKEDFELFFLTLSTVNALDVIDAIEPMPWDQFRFMSLKGVLPESIKKVWLALVADTAVEMQCLRCEDAAVREWAVNWLGGRDTTHDTALAMAGKNKSNEIRNTLLYISKIAFGCIDPDSMCALTSGNYDCGEEDALDQLKKIINNS